MSWLQFYALLSAGAAIGFLTAAVLRASTPKTAEKRRAPAPGHHAVMRLRLIEMRAADWLPDDEMHELTEAIDGVVDLLLDSKVIER